MKELLDPINEISKYGLLENLNEKDKTKNLERNLVKIYDLYFENEFEFDETEYPEFNKKDFSNIRENIASNFPKFGYYKIATLITEIENEVENLIADSIDDLNDIILDLQEVKWRTENTSVNDAKWFFNLIFESHTKNHIINLLNYLRETED
ncbi:DUF5063 domain-containing protein [Flavobacterium sp. I3-2]|uniref:DUF5063 domain-containing protein n=1 Tax=Flavobacterium sp. I3-2 TaxID=2748319 RepID=UPI0015B1B971|nr:DUF5063 domain-containing protein [Flavobacterium sp. I3-2]